MRGRPGLSRGVEGSLSSGSRATVRSGGSYETEDVTRSNGGNGGTAVVSPFPAPLRVRSSFWQMPVDEPQRIRVTIEEDRNGGMDAGRGRGRRVRRSSASGGCGSVGGG